MKNISIVVAAAHIILAVGCGSIGEVEGRVGGYGLSVKDAIFGLITDEAGKQAGFEVLVADFEHACDVIKANRLPQGSTLLSVRLIRLSSNGSFIVPDTGDFTATSSIQSAGRWTLSNFVKLDSSCSNLLPDAQSDSRSGIVKVTELEPLAALEGAFDLTFGDQGDKVKGTFSATYCDAQTQPNMNCE